MTYIKHYVNDMDDSMIQYCIYCGEIINDYRGVMYEKEFGPPQGFDAGNIFVRAGFPRILTTIEPENFIPCKNQEN